MTSTNKNSLGDLEHQVLLAALRLGDDCYSVPIVLELEKRTGREVAPAAVYIALRRLEENGLTVSEMRRDLEQGGRSRRYFRVTANGRRLLRETKRRLSQLWDGLDPAMEEPS